MTDPFLNELIDEFFRLKENGYLYHRESIDLEYKEQFNHAGWAEYLRDFAAFANNSGGYMIFGIKNSPREPIGLNERSVEMFENTDEEYISGELNKLFAPTIVWQRILIERDDKKFGIFYVHKGINPPFIACADEGVIKNGEIYYRYGGRSQKIQFAEINNIIVRRIDETNQNWIGLMSKIAKVGPANAAILDTEKGVIEKNPENILVIDNSLLSKIKFIKEGQFKEKQGATALKLVGDVSPVSSVEVTKYKTRSLLDRYPLSFTQLVEEIKKHLPQVKQNRVYEIIRDNNLKSNSDYSSYNFRNRQQEKNFIENAILPASIPSIYNHDALNLILKILRSRG